ncbi:MAG: beta-lactamase family protein [Acidobacteria bacterium]|nr:beta-lactamase family protein [Acidobacteriota bacterium]MCA1627527.1 beta-lactamase family protein [Acidobacteriota bacterium]
MKDLVSLLLLAVLTLSSVAQAQKRVATGTVPPATFADPNRKQKLAAAFPEIEKLFNTFAERMPGAVMGIVVDGEVVWVKAAGIREATNKAPVTPETVFRIASMTKSFTALAILKLRDDGKLSLDDPVTRYVPALADLPYPTSDSPTITIRHLLTHSEGFPEDNAWGDRQLAQTDETMRAWMRAGIPFSTVPGTAYEYSNYGFAILGQIIAKASGGPYANYMRDNILRPLGMNSTTFEKSEVPQDRIALGYRREDNAWKAEPILAHGSFGAMGGLWTNTHDLARWVAFLMSAFPPRDEVDRGPVKRGSVREMQQLWRMSPGSAFRSTTDAPLQLNVSGYGYGLGVAQDCRFAYVIGHGGGLPGYGSLMRWLPGYGVGLIAMSNLTYGGFNAIFNDTLDALHRTGALQPRVVKPSPALLAAQADVSQLIIKWDDALANRIMADNVFLDVPAEVRKSRWQSLAQDHGTCRPATSIDPENALRGEWRMACDRGWLNVFITLAPTIPPKVQTIGIAPVLPPDAEMTKAADAIVKLLGAWDQKAFEAIAAPGLNVEKVRRQINAASAWGSCKVGETLGGNGTRNSAIRLTCDNGPLMARIALDPASRKLTNLDLVPLREQRCVP